MAVQRNTKVQVQQVLIQPVKHTIGVARLLYTPPSYVLRGPIYLIFIITFAALAYSFWGKKDMIVQAPMRLQRESTTVQSVGGGLVIDLNATANTYAKFGDVLVSVQEQTRLAGETERDAMERQRVDLEKELAKVQDEYENTLNTFALKMQDLTTNRESRKVALEGRIRQIEEQLSAANRSLARQQERLSVARQQFARKKALFDSRDITVTEFEAAQQAVFDIEKSVDDARSVIAEINVSLTTAKDELSSLLDLKAKEQLQAEIDQTVVRRDRDIKAIQDRIAAIETKVTEGEQLIEGVSFRDNQTVYRSTFNGLITEVHVTRGQLIGAGAKLVTVVRDTAPLEAVTLVENKDIGALQRGQEVKIKYAAYPYQEYGIQEGVIIDIATTPDLTTGSQYPVRIALKSETIAKRGERPKQLEIGLEGMAEIKTGEKRLIELVFSPVSKFLAGGKDEEEL